MCSEDRSIPSIFKVNECCSNPGVLYLKELYGIGENLFEFCVMDLSEEVEIPDCVVVGDCFASVGNTDLSFSDLREVYSFLVERIEEFLFEQQFLDYVSAMKNNYRNPNSYNMPASVLFNYGLDSDLFDASCLSGFDHMEEVVEDGSSHPVNAIREFVVFMFFRYVASLTYANREDESFEVMNRLIIANVVMSYEFVIDFVQFYKYRIDKVADNFDNLVIYLLHDFGYYELIKDQVDAVRGIE